MPNLKWEAKDDTDNNANEIEKLNCLETSEIIKSSNIEDSFNEQLKITEKKNNLLILGDNKTIMKCLLDEFSNKIDLIYIDPPFATGGNFPLKINIGENGEYKVVTSYFDTWKGGIDEYLKPGLTQGF